MAMPPNKHTYIKRSSMQISLALLILLSAPIPSVASSPDSSTDNSRSDDRSLLRFIALGDWGADLSHPHLLSNQHAVADGMASVLAQTPSSSSSSSPSFVLSVGDNFYPAGVTGSETEITTRFQQTFERVYHHDAFRDIPWYIVAGNRDYDGDVVAQMNYGRMGSSGTTTRWIFPDYFQRIVRDVTFPLDNNDYSGGTIRVEILAIDTMQLVDFGESFSDMEAGQRALKDKREIHEKGMNWIEHRLGESTAEYLLVVGHYPVYSADNKGPVHGLEESLKKYQVTAYISGHVHCQEHITKDGVDYFISGTGMEISCEGEDFENLTTGGSNGVKYLLTDRENPTRAVGGFLSFDLMVDKLVARFHGESGSVLYEAELLPRSL
ncbi:hypothetical protein ACHAXS_011384 [Conticribra weissflogii]